MKKWTTKKKILITILSIIAVLLLVVIAYVIYVFGSYHRIEDKQSLKVNSLNAGAGTTVSRNVEITPQELIMWDLEHTLRIIVFLRWDGKYSRCFSKQSGIDAINGAAQLAKSENPDFMIFEEVDRDSTRSYHVSQENLINKKFDGYFQDFAVNYDSAYLFYPFNEPIGKSYSGISVYSKYEITSALRRSFPISTSFSKILDLDRCYSVSRVNVDNGKELVIYAVHMSAYGNSDAIRQGQTSMLFNDMKSEIDKGNYVICGGDFNHDLKLQRMTALSMKAGHTLSQEAKCRRDFPLQWINCQRISMTISQILTEMMIRNIYRAKHLHVFWMDSLFPIMLK